MSMMPGNGGALAMDGMSAPLAASLRATGGTTGPGFSASGKNDEGSLQMLSSLVGGGQGLLQGRGYVAGAPGIEGETVTGAPDQPSASLARLLALQRQQQQMGSFGVPTLPGRFA